MTVGEAASNSEGVTSPPANPQQQNSVYARSRTFRLGVWALARALGLILWHAVKDGLVAKKESLRTVEGTVMEQRSTETAGGSQIRLKTGGSPRIQGQRQLHTVLRIRQGNGTVSDFSADE
ncbi:MAG: hypothetical protein ABIP20_01615 [Chthoniobacteraceae bacterium]